MTDVVEAAALAGVKQRYPALCPRLDERRRRLMVAAEAVALGPRGVAAVSRATGVARTTIMRGVKELQQPEPIAEERVRRAGAGRKRAVDKDPTLLADLEGLVEPGSRGDPESALRWTSKSLRNLAAELNQKGHRIGPSLVRRLLRDMGYSLQANRKTLEGSSHPDRNAQFAHITAVSNEHLGTRQPVISVDTKKKELVGQFKNTGKELRRRVLSRAARGRHQLLMGPCDRQDAKESSSPSASSSDPAVSERGPIAWCTEEPCGRA